MVKVRGHTDGGLQRPFRFKWVPTGVRPVFRIKVSPSIKAGSARSKCRVNGTQPEIGGRSTVAVSLQVKTLDK